MRSPRPVVFAASVAMAALGGCAPSAPRAEVVRMDSAGVEVVVSEGADRALAWRLDRAWAIGGLGDARLQVSALASYQVAAGPDGRVHILDADAGRVLVIADGEVVDTLGRRGGGPGELEAPMALTVDADSGIIAVYDAGKGGLVRWSRAGAPLPTVPIDALVWGPAVEVTRVGVVFTSFARRIDQSTRLDLLLWNPHEDDALAGFISAPLQPADFPSCGQQGTLVSPLFSPEFLWDAAGGLVAANTGAAYEVDILDRKGLVRRIRRDVEPVRVNEAMALREVGDGVAFGGVDCTIPPMEAARGYGWADFLPAVMGLALSPDGELWALRGRIADEGGRIDVFGADGAYLGTLPPGTPFPAAFLPGARIVAVDVDSMGVPVVAVYRIRRG